MTTDVLDRPDAVLDDEDRVFVTLTVADQLCGVPVLGVRDILGEQIDHPHPARAGGDGRAASTCAGASSPRSTCGTACSLPPAPAGTRRMSVVAEQGGELYALLVDQVSEVMSVPAERVRTQPADPAADLGAVQRPGSIGWRTGCWSCWTSAGCWRLASRAEPHRHGAHLPGRG